MGNNIDDGQVAITYDPRATLSPITYKVRITLPIRGGPDLKTERIPLRQMKYEEAIGNVMDLGVDQGLSPRHYGTWD